MNFAEHLPFPLWEGLLRLSLSFIAGSLIGLEREKRRQPAGFRTHSVLALGSALMSILSLYIPYSYGQGTGVDPSRIASQVITGIGFLGAGAIIRIGVSIKGLTTAASLWTTAGIGLSIGAGMYLLSVFAFLLLLLTLSIMSKIEREFINTGNRYVIDITIDYVEDPISYLRDLIGNFRLRKISKINGGFQISVESELTQEMKYILLNKLLKEKSIRSLEIL
ncbi:MAG: MgtC/SapB family protein [Hydrogenobacter sp.]|uniref:MgtC/SapB family protein n=1 Tax=Hydrogenobacter thermophilus TaxID=940 RepID=UPI0030FBEF27